jgi:hypothetical protein
MRFHLAIGILGAMIIAAGDAHSAGAQSASPIVVAADTGADKKPSGTPTPRFRKQSPYAAVRQRLISSGWRPAASPDADTCMEGDTRCQGRPEMESCAGTAEANCLFLWRKGAVIIGVSTVEDPPVIASVRCRSGCKKNKSR